jgi:LmbE family N-acetylglucosaminyl deacetylase
VRISRANRRRIWVYGLLLLAVIALYFYQPIRIDFFPKRLPVPNPHIDPGSVRLFAKGAKVMVVTAHPDDSEYYLGPFLMRLAKAGAHVDLVVCTDGDKSYYPWQNGSEMRRTRRAEQTEAAAVWKACSVTFLGYPDGRLHPNSDVVDAIHSLILQESPEWLITFDGDYPPRISHGDHRSAGQAAALAVPGTGVAFEMFFATRAANYVADTSDFEDRERELLALHRSEFTGAKLDRVDASVESVASEEGDPAGFTFGVAFRCVPCGAKLH